MTTETPDEETPVPVDAGDEPEVETLEVEAEEAAEDEGEQEGADDVVEATGDVPPADNSAASPHPQDRERGDPNKPAPGADEET